MIVIFGAMVIVAFAVGAFVVIKSVQLGLRWQAQISKGNEPTLQSPIGSVLKKAETDKLFKQQIAAQKEAARLQDEWINGKKQ